MDREVAAGWFDIMLLDTEHKFTSYLHNIPIESFISNDSSRTDYLVTSGRYDFPIDQS